MNSYGHIIISILVLFGAYLLLYLDKEIFGLLSLYIFPIISLLTYAWVFMAITKHKPHGSAE